MTGLVSSLGNAAGANAAPACYATDSQVLATGRVTPPGGRPAHSRQGNGRPRLDISPSFPNTADRSGAETGGRVDVLDAAPPPWYSRRDDRQYTMTDC